MVLSITLPRKQYETFRFWRVAARRAEKILYDALPIANHTILTGQEFVKTLWRTAENTVFTVQTTL